MDSCKQLTYETKDKSRSDLYHTGTHTIIPSRELSLPSPCYVSQLDIDYDKSQFPSLPTGTRGWS